MDSIEILKKIIEMKEYSTQKQISKKLNIDINIVKRAYDYLRLFNVSSFSSLAVTTPKSDNANELPEYTKKWIENEEIEVIDTEHIKYGAQIFNRDKTWKANTKTIKFLFRNEDKWLGFDEAGKLHAYNLRRDI